MIILFFSWGCKIKGENKCKKEIECILDKLRVVDSQKANFIKYKHPDTVQGR